MLPGRALRGALHRGDRAPRGGQLRSPPSPRRQGTCCPRPPVPTSVRGSYCAVRCARPAVRQNRGPARVVTRLSPRRTGADDEGLVSPESDASSPSLSMRVLSRIPLHPVLFAAYAVLFLYAANLALVLPVDVAAPLVRSVARGRDRVGRARRPVPRARRGAVVATAGVVAFFAFGHVRRRSRGPRPGRPGAARRCGASSIVAAVVYAIRARGLAADASPRASTCSRSCCSRSRRRRSCRTSSTAPAGRR